MTWHDNAVAIIGQVHSTLPVDASVAVRKQALRNACPFEFRSTSWGRTVWGRAVSAYLQAHGINPRPRRIPLSPLERLMQRASR